jgi:surface antigen/peptidoglycan hydrolase CwlO-like protein
MKLRTALDYKSFIRKSILTFSVIVVALIAPIQSTEPVSADQYDDKINTLQQNINQYQAEADRLNDQAATLQTALAQLANEKAAIQAQIYLNQAKYDQLVIDIANTEKQIADNQDVLGDTIANLYVDEKISPLEMLASSKNISDYLDKQEYRNSVRDQLTSIIKEVKDLKIQLDTKKNDVEKILAEQKAQRDSLIGKENEQAGLLDRTQNSEVAYQNLIKDSATQIAEAKATQAAINSRINGSGGFILVDSGSLGDYTWNSSNCPMLGYLSTGGSDGKGGDGHGYGCRQCASYVAWRIAKETSVYPSWGDAVNFTNGAINTFNSSDGPAQAGAIAIMDPAKAGQFHGHVAWVEAVNGDQVLVSQYNYNYGAGYGMYSKMWLSVSAFDHYVKII